ncbi:Putative tryptophan synthase beta chain-like, PALP domain-containing protein [Colletotrichum destructivum]|uniref:Tryptophan synthase beta chain-like, PALP domain-containing protein n=1 Tax=Colletotrichum destructivum TaxID=34406 RepID=A0AAX4IQP4_9PEZI|nr:Putative tryptophan synthase beta chain-like, PALP domain-containing protein [Colletotrichum destructivum]
MQRALRASDSALAAIGNTPLVRLRRLVPPNHAEVYLKLEYTNPTGSHKDRMAAAIIEKAELRGALKPGMKVVEATGGSTGSSLAFVCAVRGYRFQPATSDAFAPEKLRTMAAFGASVDIIRSPSGRITADLIPAMIRRARSVADEDSAYATDQFNNADALVGYEGLGREILAQLPEGVDAFCAAVGTAGLAMGVSSVLKAARRDTRVVVLEPASTPVITEGRAGAHGVEGIGIGFLPPLLDRALYDEARAVEEDEARAMCRRLAREEGIFAGVSTGMNAVAAIRLARELGPRKRVVTIACDSGLKYLNSDLFHGPQ